MKLSFLSAAIAAAFVSGPAMAGVIFSDNFTVAQSVSATGLTDGASTSADLWAGPGEIFRQLRVNNTSPTSATATSTFSVANGVLRGEAPADATPSYEVSYFGSFFNSLPNPLPASVIVTFTAFDQATGFSNLYRPVLGTVASSNVPLTSFGSTPIDVTLSYTGNWGGASNWQTGFSLQFASRTPGLDIMVSQIEFVPAPATIGLLGLGLVGIGFMRRRQAA